MIKKHVYRLVFALVVVPVAGVLFARALIVPDDFGAHERGYMYGWHRKGNEADWKKFTVKFKFNDYCEQCHPENWGTIMKSPHAIIKCENCHGPSLDHPNKPVKLSINKERSLCLRCHSKMPYKGTARGNIRGIVPNVHNVEYECVMCHNPHSPNLQSLTGEAEPSTGEQNTPTGEPG